jgi:vacuolar-type H+-ATPase subunit H
LHPVAADPKQSEALRQIQEAFQSAQSQMAQLRQQVEKHAELARAKTQNDFAQKEVERALRQLGESVFKQVQKGRLALPEGFGPLLKAVEHAQQKAESQAREIGDLLQEGEETAQRMKEKNVGGTNSGVASRMKKL